MAVVGLAEILVRPSMAGFQKTVAKEVDGAAGSPGVEKAGGTLGGKLSSGLKKSLKVGAVAIGAALGTSMWKGLERLQAIEGARAKLTGLGHDATAVQGIMDNSLAAVKGTSFGLGDAATTAANLVASGIKPGKDLERVLKSVTNSSSAAGVEMSEVGAIYQKVASSGKAQNDVLSQVADKGIPIYQALATELGVTAGAVFDMAKDGAIDFQTFEKAMTTASGTVADEMGKTLPGALKNAWASIGRFGANLLSEVYPQIRDFVTGFIDQMGPLEDKAKVIGAFLGDALKGAVTWISNNKDAIIGFLPVLATAVGGLAAYFAITKTMAAFKAIQTWYAATTFAQKGLNAAMKANPIGLIIAAVTLLVAGIVWLYKNNETAKRIIDGAWTGIKNAVLVAWDFIKVAFDAISNFVTGVLAPAFVWFYKSVIVPVWEGIQTAIVATVGFITAVVGNVVSFFRDKVAPVFVWLYNSIIKPYFTFILTLITVVIALVIAAVQGLIYVWKNALAPAIKWVWENVIKPVFSALGSFFKWVWNSVLKPAFEALKIAFKAVGTFAKGVWDSILKPVFKALGDFFKWVFDFILKPAFAAVKWYFQSMATGLKNVWNTVLKPVFKALGDFFNWVWVNVLRPAFEAVKSAFGVIGTRIKSIWNNNIKPIFQALGSFVRDTVAPVFQKGVDKIKSIWESIKEFAKKPISFVINTVINDGLIAAFNKVAGWIPGVKKLDRVKVPGFARGGWTGPGSKYQEAGIVHADEFVVRKESQRSIARKAPGFLDSLNRYGAAALGYANGGLVRPAAGPYTSRFGASRGAYPHAGIDIAAAVGSSVNAALAGVVERAGWNVVPGRTGIGMLLAHQNGQKTYYGHLSRTLAKVGDQVSAGQRIANSGNTGKSTGPHLHFELWNGGQPINPESYLAGAALPAGQAGGGGGFNPLEAFTGLTDKVGKWIAEKFPGGGQMVDMVKGVGGKLITDVRDWAKSKLDAIGDFMGDAAGDVATSGGALKYRGMAADALRHTGDYSLGNLNSLIRRMRQESSFNPRAINNTDSNARRGTPSKGLMQVIDPTFQSYRDRALGNDIWDPFQNTVASIRYAKARYGNVRAGWDRKGGYADGGLVNPMAYLHDQGGMLMPGLSLLMNKTGKPEPVLNQRQWADIHSLAVSRTTGSGEVSVTVVAPEKATANEYFVEAKHQLAVMNRRGGRR